jgi:hypothetical protein
MARVRAALIGCCIGALGFAAFAARATAATGARHVTVAMCDLEAVPQELMDLAQQVAIEVYRDAGIEIDWDDNQCHPAENVFAVTITARRIAGTDVSDYTLGFAESGMWTATVLYDRVSAFARRYRMKRAVLLGYTIAHELGHLLLPPHSHSTAGVMRATINLEMAATRQLWFTTEQRQLILGKVAVVSAYTAAARPQNCCDATRAPSAIAASLPQTTSGSTAAWPTHVP